MVILCVICVKFIYSYMINKQNHLKFEPITFDQSVSLGLKRYEFFIYSKCAVATGEFNKKKTEEKTLETLCTLIENLLGMLFVNVLFAFVSFKMGYLHLVFVCHLNDNKLQWFVFCTL